MNTTGRPNAIASDLSRIPNFCAHEHWGSIGSFGADAEGFRSDMVRGAVPYKETGLLDILLDPYFGGCVAGAGIDIDAVAASAGARDRDDLMQRPISETMRVLRPALGSLHLTGTFQCIRRGIEALYGIDIVSPDANFTNLNADISSKYEAVFDWYCAAMERMSFSSLVRPVHPQYYVMHHSQETAEKEFSFTRTVMRIDPLLDMWREKSDGRSVLAEITGVDPVDADSWRAFLNELFRIANNNGALGIKQLQAYSRSLEFVPRADNEVKWQNNLTAAEVRVFQDWVVHECSRLAADRGWVHQVHVGTHNLGESSPLPLAALAQRYPNMKLVLIHCWPFLDEASTLARNHHNLYLDTCWLPVLNPEFYRNALRCWLNYVPLNKIMCSHDSTSVEMAAGSSLFTREILAQELMCQEEKMGLRRSDILKVAADLLNNNAVKVYGVGELY